MKFPADGASQLKDDTTLH